jgi:hypothetical protein
VSGIQKFDLKVLSSGSEMREVICPLDVDPRVVVLVRSFYGRGYADADLVRGGSRADALGVILPDLGRWARDFLMSEEEQGVLVPLDVVCEHVQCE